MRLTLNKVAWDWNINGCFLPNYEVDKPGGIAPFGVWSVFAERPDGARQEPHTEMLNNMYETLWEVLDAFKTQAGL